MPAACVPQEHAGNDPTTQLVPASSGSGTWNRPEDAAGGQDGSGAKQALTAQSTWASGAGPALGGPHGAAPARRLNDYEFPTLADSSKLEAAGGRDAPPSVKPDQGQPGPMAGVSRHACMERCGRPQVQATGGLTMRDHAAIFSCPSQSQDVRSQWPDDERGAGWRGHRDM